MICPNCKSNIPDDSRFCPDCGVPVVNVEDLRAKAKEIVSNYKQGYEFYVNNGTLPRFAFNSTIENCEKIIAYKQTIIQKHKEIESREPKYETIHYTDGSRYEGYTVHGVKQGKGTYYATSGGRYVGDWYNDQGHGKGTEYYSNGDRYEGDFKNGKREGHGTYCWSNGDRYEGDFKNGKKEGHGTYCWSNGNRYVGDWYNDQRHGKGTEYYSNGDRYEGDWYNDQRHGKGTEYYSNGERYKGDFENGKRHGYGIYYRNNGSSRRNEWRNDTEIRHLKKETLGGYVFVAICIIAFTIYFSFIFVKCNSHKTYPSDNYNDTDSIYTEYYYYVDSIPFEEY